MGKVYDVDVRELVAIRARIQGKFDNPELVAFGPLTADTLVDVLRIAEEGIRRAYEEEGGIS